MTKDDEIEHLKDRIRHWEEYTALLSRRLEHAQDSIARLEEQRKLDGW